MLVDQRKYSLGGQRLLAYRGDTAAGMEGHVHHRSRRNPAGDVSLAPESDSCPIPTGTKRSLLHGSDDGSQASSSWLNPFFYHKEVNHEN